MYCNDLTFCDVYVMKPLRYETLTSRNTTVPLVSLCSTCQREKV
jgi:hypothetical protein